MSAVLPHSKKTVAMSELEPIISELLRDGGKAEITMTGNSMLPFLHDRKDVIVLEGILAGNKVQKYDVLFYRRKCGTYVLHRVVGADEKGYVMCGDAQFNLERGITDDMIIARLCGFYTEKNPRKFISRNSKTYKFKVFLWVNSRGIRYFFFRVKRKLNSIFNR